MNTPKNSTMFNFRIGLKLYKQMIEVVKAYSYFSIASFIREAIKEKISRDLKNAK